MNNYGYDKYGNIYVIKNNEYYQLDIDKNDDVYVNKIHNKHYFTDVNDNDNNDNDNNDNDNNDNDNNDGYKKIHKQNMLHIKSIENALEELEELSDEDEREKFTDIYEQNDDYKYNPEKKYFHQENIIDNISDDDIDNLDRDIIIYQNLNDLNKVNLNIDNKFIPSYETLIIDGTEKSNNLIFRTEIINDQPLYRITIFTSGNLLLNIIGTKIKKFILNYETLEITKSEN
jgi:hypothetical protein